MKRYIFTLLLFSCVVFNINAQIGINQQQPNPLSALEINGNGNKGLLIPKMTVSQRRQLPADAPNGLLVYDQDERMFYFYNGNDWIALNPLQANDGNTDTLKLADGTSIITLDNNTVVSGALTVNSNTTLQSPVVVNNTLTTNGNIISNGNITSNGNINAGTYSIDAGTVNATTVNVGAGTVITTDKVKSTSFEGYGVTPIGGIIMWSGIRSSIPDGWALCDGKDANGYTTPDLRGRFIVGYGENDAGMPSNVWGNYTELGNLSTKHKTPGNRGGEMKHTLSLGEMPEHSHALAITNGGEGNSNRNCIENNDEAIHNSPERTYNRVSIEGNNQPHENRPPYYVLAFIMRVK